MITFEEFKEGEELHYRGYNYKPHTAVYRVGVGLYIYRAGREVCKCPMVNNDDLAKSFYDN